ncbi:hypothetical protein VTK26DRAFT_84 [Humicola hyalothermophila]
MTAFARSDLFIDDSPVEYKPFMSVDTIRASFFSRVKVCLAIGGPGDTGAFGIAATTDESRQRFAKNVAATLDRLGFDCVDTYPLLLTMIKREIGDKELSIAAPGLERDMAAYTPKNIKHIANIVDFVMAYDLVDHRDNIASHHTSIKASLASVSRYIERGLPPNKINLGLAFHARWFATAPGQTCQIKTGTGYFSTRFALCRTLPLEHADGSDTGMTGTMSFDSATFAEAPKHVALSPNGTCGSGTAFRCPGTTCCSQHGCCGTEPAHCGVGCQAGFGRCWGRSIKESFKQALASSRHVWNERLRWYSDYYDWKQGAKWYWDSDGGIFWSWDTGFNMKRKIKKIVMKTAAVVYLPGLALPAVAQDLVPSPTESVGHCEAPRPTDEPAVTPIITTPAHGEDRSEHTDAAGTGSLAPSPTESIGCVPHGDHWHCERPRPSPTAETSETETSMIATLGTLTLTTTTTTTTTTAGPASSTEAPATSSDLVATGAAAAIGVPVVEAAPVLGILAFAAFGL